MSASSLSQEHTKLILDGTKIAWHQDRIKAWERGERIAPVTIDMALTRACNYGCHYCYAMMQENERHPITKEVMMDFLDDCAELGVKAISFVSDGESTISPAFVDSVVRGSELGISMAVGSNAYVLNEHKLRQVLPHLTYLRVNITAGERRRYAEIMGVPEKFFDQVRQNILDMVRLKKEMGLSVTIGLQMVLMPQYEDQILPLARLGQELRPDYLVIKHCSDNEDGFLGVDYDGYQKLYSKLREAEALSDEGYQVVVKWSKIEAKGTRSYQRCYGPPFLIQLSGSGLVAPCGMLFNEKYKKFHVGNITRERFKDIVRGDRYWEVMNYLASPDFNAQKMCGSLCLQHKVNEHLDGYMKGERGLEAPPGPLPAHLNFV
jgi:MoaA/NifB/PqqE/SkfB family radical SAM enzyme